MERLTSNAQAEREPDEARAWLARKHLVPPLEDRSLEGRRAFLAVHGDVLWAFWRDMFSLAYDDGTLRPAVALGSSREDAGAEVAERLCEALRTRPTLETAPAWTQIERWHGWLVGQRAVAAHRQGQPPRAQASPGDETPSGDEGGGAEGLVDLEMLLDRWAEILRCIVIGTGVAAIEFDWLWATRRARKPLSEAFAAHPAYGQLTDANLDACVRRSSAPGGIGPERSRRSRAGACAAFRFNLEEFAGRAPGTAGLAAARRVFIGPADPEGPYHRPRLAIDGEASDGFRETLRRGAELSACEPDDGQVDRLWKRVIACGLNKSVLRLLPASSARLLEHEMNGLLATRPASDYETEETS